MVNLISKVLSGVVALSSYMYFFATFLAVAVFAVNGQTYCPTISEFFPYGIDLGIVHDDFNTALMKNVALLGFFAIPHSLFARPLIKKMLGEKENPPSMYRSIYVA
jgi:hypothetical protein